MRVLAKAALTAFLVPLPLLGAGHAAAAPVPTIAVTGAGDRDWQITYQRGSRLRPSTTCRVVMDDRTLRAPALVGGMPFGSPSDEKPGKTVRPAAPPSSESFTLRGRYVLPGAHRVYVACGRIASPTVWLIAPRHQILDGVTWLSNGTAGLFGY